MLPKPRKYQHSRKKNELVKKLNNKEKTPCDGCPKLENKIWDNFKIKKIIFLDKDENMLTELNRELLLFKNFRKINREFVCSDLNSMDISDILLKDKVQFYLNFAAIKHVRSEENIQSIKYMFKTNSINFVPRKLMNLKKIFSISTDKTVNPSSILGVSKYLMEMNLSKYKNKK